MKNYNFFGAKIAKSTFFQFFHNKSLLFCFKSEWRFSWGFFWGILRFCKSKIGDFRIFASDFFHFDLGHFRYLLRPNYEPQRPQILAEDASFHMKQCLFDQYQNWSVQRPLSLSGSFWPPPRILNRPKSPHWLGLRRFFAW